MEKNCVKGRYCSGSIYYDMTYQGFTRRKIWFWCLMQAHLYSVLSRSSGLRFVAICRIYIMLNEKHDSIKATLPPLDSVAMYSRGFNCWAVNVFLCNM